MRCISIGEAFQKYNKVKVYCLTSSNLEGFKELFTSSNIECIRLSNFYGLSYNFKNKLNLSFKDITIFDNYDVTFHEMKKYKEIYPNLVAIDDIADREFNADIIINQNFSSNQLNYKVNKKAKFLLGPNYTLLRSNILNTIRKKEKNRIFMSFGGGDVFKRIKKILNFLLQIDKTLNHNIYIDFIINCNRKDKISIKKLLSLSNKIKFNFIENELDLSKYMGKADFALTAAGSTVFELAFLGVPQLTIVIDKNQKIIGDKIDETGIGLCLGDINSINSSTFNINFLRFLSDNNMKNKMSNKGTSLIDGKGSRRVAKKIMNYYNYN